MSDIRRKFGQSIYKLRHQKQLSQMELAARADVHLNTVNLVEAGKKDVQLETIEKLAKGLDCELSELFLTIENQRST
jgi:transcriptional regulator with XRE-family HTH domain